jgi:hypothetical protein
MIQKMVLVKVVMLVTKWIASWLMMILNKTKTMIMKASLKEKRKRRKKRPKRNKKRRKKEIKEIEEIVMIA